MAREPRQQPSQPEQDATAERAVCGIIMPISATTSEHDERHWSDVLKLVSRAIDGAGFEPRPVWEKSVTDRVSERIVANIFEFPIVVADISDQNPNVMLELGLRLASKKPTVMIVNKGGAIPFDVRDFHAVMYPENLNMLGMEAFFTELGSDLKAKHQAWTENTYEPFLSKVVVDVLSPETREVGVDQLVLDQLDEINRRISRMETNSRIGVPLPTKADIIAAFEGVPSHQLTLSYLVPSDTEKAFSTALIERGFTTLSSALRDQDGRVSLMASPSPTQTPAQRSRFTKEEPILLHRFGAVRELPYSEGKLYGA